MLWWQTKSLGYSLKYTQYWCRNAFWCVCTSSILKLSNNKRIKWTVLLQKKETFINSFFNILNTRFSIQAAAALFIQCRQWVSLSAERASGVIPTDCPSRCSLQRGATTIHSPDPFSPFTNKVTPSIFIWIAENRGCLWAPTSLHLRYRHNL